MYTIARVDQICPPQNADNGDTALVVPSVLGRHSGARIMDFDAFLFFLTLLAYYDVLMYIFTLGFISSRAFSPICVHLNLFSVLYSIMFYFCPFFLLLFSYCKAFSYDSYTVLLLLKKYVYLSY